MKNINRTYGKIHNSLVILGVERLEKFELHMIRGGGDPSTPPILILK